MSKNISHYKLSILLLLVFLLSSCHTINRVAVSSDTAAISRSLGIRVSKNDYLPLYRSAASWMGTPYKYGGNMRSGIDCSGLTRAIYLSAYGISLNRNSEDIHRNCYHITKHNLREGDFVFFSTGKNRRINHVGIYLKEGYFIHSSTSRGVILSHIKEPYYVKTWRGAGRIKK